MTTASTHTIPIFNGGQAFRVVRDASDGRLGLVDHDASTTTGMRVWFEMEYTTTCTSSTRLTDVPMLPDIPCGSFVEKFIGGVSRTVRHVGCLRARVRHRTESLSVFATHAPSGDAVRHALATLCDAVTTVGEEENDDEFGIVVEVVVHDVEDVDHVCAVLSRVGATPLLDRDESVNARQCIGIERLDRIESDCVAIARADTDDVQFGARRGARNWRFEWLPVGWRPPITWDHMIENVATLDITEIPQPLRQHVAAHRLRHGTIAYALGSHWRRMEHPPNPSEIAFATDHPAHTHMLQTLMGRVIVHRPNVSRILTERTWLSAAEVDAAGLVHRQSMVCADDGVWYVTCDPRNHLVHEVKTERWVSAALTTEQSHQLITAFYILSVERVRDPIVRRQASLILFRYMFERGYTARWMGKYDQDAHFIGNGTRLRAFKRLSQYDPHRLPTKVLNRLCNREGKLVSRGSKGTRSKYRTENRYVPVTRLHRSDVDETRMVVPRIASRVSH